MKAHDILYALGDIDRDLVEQSEGKHKTKRIILRILAAAACLCFAILPALPSLVNPYPTFKRIDLSAEVLGDADETINFFTKIKSNVIDTFATTIPIYEITPRTITDEEFYQFADYFGMQGEATEYDDTLHLSEKEQTVLLREESNRLSYWTSYDEKPITKTDDELIEQAKEIFHSLPIIDGEYECLGVLSEQTVEHGLSGTKMTVVKRIGFRKLIDGTRIIGNDRCDLYFSEDGLTDIELELYNYTKVGEIPMLSLDDAIDKIKKADAFSVDTDGTTFSGIADKLTVERVKLLYVNQYSSGCTILQPVFNLMGTAENDTGKAEFSAKIIAIPKKYTYEDD